MRPIGASIRPRRGTLLGVVVVAVSCPMVCPAAQWSSPTGGSFQDAGRWSPVGIPGSSDNAEFPHAGTYTVGFSADAATDRLIVTGGNVTLDLNHHTYSALKPSLLATSPASFHINGSGAPTLTVTNGRLDIKSAVLGEGSGNSGALVVDGVGSLLDASESLYLGQSSTGTVAVTSGAKGKANAVYVGMTGGTLSGNVLSVVGAGSDFTIADQLNIGFFGGHGTAAVANGGVLKIGKAVLAPYTDSQANLVVGADSQVHVLGDALLGMASGGAGGTGTLWAQGGGTIVIDGALKYDHNSKIILNGSLDVGSMTRVNGLPHVGSLVLWQQGTLRVRSDVTTFDLGFSSFDENSTLQIDGDLHLDLRRSFGLNQSDNQVMAGSLSGNGEFNFRSGTLRLGSLTLGTDPSMRQSLHVDSQFPLAATLVVSGNTDIQAGGSLDISAGKGTFDGIVVNSGSFHIHQSQVAFNGTGALGFQGLVSTGNLSIRNSTIAGTVMPGPGSSFQVDGEVTFNGPLKTHVDITRPVGTDRPKINLNSEFHMGTVASQTATIVIEADMALGPDSKLLFGIGGTGSGQYDTLEVEGGVTLGGTIEVSLLSGYTPSLGDRFQLITADRLLGNFAGLVLPTLPGGLEFDLGRIQRGELVVLSGLEGDFNNDGTVDAADYTVWRNALGSVSVAIFNDSSPGVGIDDYERWKSAYGTTLSQAAVMAAQVPEPTGMLPMLVLFLLVWRVGTQRHLLTAGFLA